MRKLRLIILVSFIPFCLCSQIADKTKLDTYLQTLADKGKFMGSVAISVNGSVVYSKAVGFADMETKTPSFKRLPFPFQHFFIRSIT